MTNVYVLRTCKADMTSHNGFKWPKKGDVKAPDWDKKPECGNGLHGQLWGNGDPSLLNWSEDAAWLVCKVATKDIVDLSGKVKFPKCKVVFCGDRKGATDYIIKCGADPAKVVGAFLTGGDGATLTGGDGATLTGGNWATLTGGDWATLSWRVWDSTHRRITTVYVGEKGIKANTPYRLENGEVVEVKK